MTRPTHARHEGVLGYAWCAHCQAKTQVITTSDRQNTVHLRVCQKCATPSTEEPTLPSNFVQNDRLEPHTDWSWLDENGIVHATKVVVDDGIRYWAGAVACDNRSVTDFIRCNMPVTCIGCLALRDGR